MVLWKSEETSVINSTVNRHTILRELEITGRRHWFMVKIQRVEVTFISNLLLISLTGLTADLMTNFGLNLETKSLSLGN